jgi:type I restriction enzyme S subunit
MNAERLLAQFERISEAPDAITRLRRSILDLAVRGKLVEQDPEDEPAEELLMCIAKHNKPSLPTASDKSSFPFELPTGWTRTTFRTLVESSGSGWSPKALDTPREGNEWGILKVSAVSWDQFRPEANKQILPGTQPRPHAVVRKGDFLISRANTAELVARAVIVDSEPVNLMMSDKIVRLELVDLCEPKYILINNNHSTFSRSYYADRATGVSPSMKNVTRDVILDLPIPLPPLAEQHRIVAKVDELMALCDQLEAARQQRQQGRERLMAATLQRLNQPAADPASFRKDASFALQVLPSLTTTPAQIKQLRQTILNLAVRGKLVEQDPEDEPAEELLKVINGERRLLLMSGYPNVDEARAQLRKQASVSEPVPPHWLPAGWAWTTLMRCSALVVDCRNKTAPYVLTGVPLVRTTNVKEGGLVMEDMRYVDEGIAKIWSSRCEPQPGDILITREAPMGEACIIPEDMRICLGQRMMLARMVPGTIFNCYILYMLRDPFLMDRVQDKPVGATVQHLRVGGIESLLVPLPPLAEQHRIVAKVDELMALCDQLEQQLSQADHRRRRLLEAVLAEALGDSEPALASLA